MVKQENQVCAILQPHYLPWMGYFEMIDRVDVFVFLDDVQYEDRGWQNRNQIRKTSDSIDNKWLTVPIKRRNHRQTLLKDIEMSTDIDWVSRHKNSLYNTYKRSPYFKKYFESLITLLRESKDKSLMNLNVRLIVEICKLLRISTTFRFSSEFSLPSKKDQKLLDICLALETDCYLANNATAGYADKKQFFAKGIQFLTQDYLHPTYSQKNSNLELPFLSHLSIVDVLFNQGEASLKVLKKGGRNLKFDEI